VGVPVVAADEIGVADPTLADPPGADPAGAGPPLQAATRMDNPSRAKALDAKFGVGSRIVHLQGVDDATTQSSRFRY
jgi:hypothetical protein